MKEEIEERLLNRALNLTKKAQNILKEICEHNMELQEYFALQGTELKINKAKRTKEKSLLPDNYNISEEMQIWLKTNKFLNVEVKEELDKFKDYHLSKNNRYSDWDAAFRTWMRNTRIFAKPFARERKKSIEEILEHESSNI